MLQGKHHTTYENNLPEAGAAVLMDRMALSSPLRGHLHYRRFRAQAQGFCSDLDQKGLCQEAKHLPLAQAAPSLAVLHPHSIHSLFPLFIKPKTKSTKCSCFLTFFFFSPLFSLCGKEFAKDREINFRPRTGFCQCFSYLSKERDERRHYPL